MDYKEIIEAMRSTNVKEVFSRSIDAADAIETLLAERDKTHEQLQDLQAQWDMYGGDEGITATFQKAAERDAAVEDLRGNCWCCANGKPWEKAGPLSKMTCCEHLKEWGAVATSGKACKCQHWQWRGPQKHD